MATFSSVMKDLQLLTQADQRKIRAALDTIIGDNIKDDTVKDSEVAAREGLFYGSMSDYLERRISRALPPLQVFKAQAAYKSLKVCLKEVDSYFEHIMKKKQHRRDDRLLFYDVYFKLMGRNLNDLEIPLAPGALLQAYERFPGQLDNAYPGYVSNGLFFALMRAKRDGKPVDFKNSKT